MALRIAKSRPRPRAGLRASKGRGRKQEAGGTLTAPLLRRFDLPLSWLELLVCGWLYGSSRPERQPYKAVAIHTSGPILVRRTAIAVQRRALVRLVPYTPQCGKMAYADLIQ